MLAYLTEHGRRKYTLGLAYLIVCMILNIIALTGGASMDLQSLGGMAALNTSMATGLGVVVYGNVKEHQAKNGNGK